jgi:hypothetical protein
MILKYTLAIFWPKNDGEKPSSMNKQKIAVGFIPKHNNNLL